MDFPLKLDNNTPSNPIFTPVNIAILASLGLHGFVLGLALPHFTWPQPTEASFGDRAPVGVIELTPAEQSRLPNTDPLPANPLLPVLPEGEPPPSSPTAPNLPAAPDSNYDYQLPDSSNLPPLPTMPSLPNLPAYPNLPPLTSYGNLRRFPITNPPLPSLPPLPSRRLPRLPVPSDPRFADTAPPLPPISSNDPARPRFDPLPPPQGTDFITRAPQGQDNGAVNNAVAQPELVPEGEDSSPDQVRVNSLNSIAQQGVAIKAKDVIAGPYPAIACRNRSETSVTYNVFPSGQKDLVGRSRYPIFNDLAAKVIGGRSYSQPTQVTVSFQYDPKVCADVTQFDNPPTPQTPQPPTDPRPLGTPTVPTVETPSSAPMVPTPPAVETPAPVRPGMTPSPSPVQPPTQTTPAPQVPRPQPSIIPDAPANPRPTATPIPDSPAPAVQPTPAVAPPPAGSSPQRSLPRSKGEILREQNRAPFVPPSPKPTPESNSSDSP